MRKGRGHSTPIASRSLNSAGQTRAWLRGRQINVWGAGRGAPRRPRRCNCVPSQVQLLQRASGRFEGPRRNPGSRALPGIPMDIRMRPAPPPPPQPCYPPPPPTPAALADRGRASGGECLSQVSTELRARRPELTRPRGGRSANALQKYLYFISRYLELFQQLYVPSPLARAPFPLTRAPTTARLRPTSSRSCASPEARRAPAHPRSLPTAAKARR